MGYEPQVADLRDSKQAPFQRSYEVTLRISKDRSRDVLLGCYQYVWRYSVICASGLNTLVPELAPQYP